MASQNYHPNSVIHGLPVCEWRGEVAPPYDVAGFSFSHRQAEFQYYGVNGSSHRWAGMNTTPMPFKFYFLNSLEQQLFPDKWNIWQELLFDGKPGKLKHPLRGTVDAVVLSGDVRLEARTTAGVIVEVQFTDTLLDPSKTSKLAVVDVSVVKLSGACREACDNPELNFPSQDPVTDLLDIFDQIDSWLYSMDLLLQGQINQWQERISDFISIIKGQSVGTKNWAAYTLLVNLWGALEDTKNQMVANQARPTATATTLTNTTIDAIARERENTVEEIMELNVSLLSKSWVPKGTAYRYYTG